METYRQSHPSPFYMARLIVFASLLLGTFATASLPFLFRISKNEESIRSNLILPFLGIFLAWIAIFVTMLFTRKFSSLPLTEESMPVRLSFLTNIVISPLGSALSLLFGIMPAFAPGPTSDKYLIALLFMFALIVSAQIATAASILSYFVKRLRNLFIFGIFFSFPTLLVSFYLLFSLASLLSR